MTNYLTCSRCVYAQHHSWSYGRAATEVVSTGLAVSVCLLLHVGFQSETVNQEGQIITQQPIVSSFISRVCVWSRLQFSIIAQHVSRSVAFGRVAAAPSSQLKWFVRFISLFLFVVSLLTIDQQSFRTKITQAVFVARQDRQLPFVLMGIRLGLR